MRFVSRFLRIQPGEGRLVALVMSLMFVAMAAIAIGMFAVVALFQLITLPVEYDASRRAKEQLLAIGDRSFPVREKQLELQHPNVAFFNVAFKHLPQKPS